jgi:hypothetical protein
VYRVGQLAQLESSEAAPEHPADGPEASGWARALRTFSLSALAGSLIAWNWFRLEEGSTAGAGSLVVLLAIAPAMVQGWRRRVPLAIVAFLLAVGGAFQLGPSLYFPGRLASRFSHGFLEFYDVALPFDPNAHSWMHGTIVVGVFGFTLLCAIAIAAREPQPAAIALLFGAGWPATLLQGNDYLRGSFLLVGLLVVFVGARRSVRGVEYAPAAIALVAVAAVAASTSPALAKQGFLNWQKWDFYTKPVKPVSVSYVWNSSYAGFSFPKKKTVVLKIKAPARSQYWLVAPLNVVVKGRWEVHGTEQAPTDGSVGEPGLVPAVATMRSNWVAQRVTVEALRDHFLPAADSPTQFDASNLGQVYYDPSGIAYLQSGLHRGDTYGAWSFEAQPSPAELARSRAAYPSAIAADGEYLEVENGVLAPPFGTPDRVRTMRGLFAASSSIDAYRPLYLDALRVAGGAHSPYAATVALESWFRSGGGFVYDQHPPKPNGVPALVDFVTRTHRGYCQHFAGAMALMLRYLGIPARVAAGFSSGTYDKHSGQWTVTDHDAHEWVEVWFRGWGWLPFDPTPGVGGLAGGYSASSKAFDSAAAAAVLAGKNGLNQFDNHRSELGFPGNPLHLSADAPFRGKPLQGAAGSHGHGPPALLMLVLFVVAGVVVAIAVAKLVVRRGRYLTSDPRRLAAACHRELRDILLDQGIPVPASATPAELAALAELKLDVEAVVLAPHVTVARFGPPAAAREEAHELRRSMRALRKGVRRELTGVERARGLVSLRSLGLA